MTFVYGMTQGSGWEGCSLRRSGAIRAQDKQQAFASQEWVPAEYARLRDDCQEAGLPQGL